MKTFQVIDCKDKKILDLASGLKDAGLGEFAEQYYNEGQYDFFQINKQENGQDVSRIYVDIEPEGYSVHCIFGHEHVKDLEEAIKYIRDLKDGKLCDCLFVAPGVSMTAFVECPEGEFEQVLQSIVASFQLPILNYHVKTKGQFTVLSGDHMHVPAEMPENPSEFVTIPVEKLPKVLSSLRVSKREFPPMNDFRVYVRVSRFDIGKDAVCLLQQ